MVFQAEDSDLGVAALDLRKYVAQQAGISINGPDFGESPESPPRSDHVSWLILRGPSFSRSLLANIPQFKINFILKNYSSSALRYRWTINLHFLLFYEVFVSCYYDFFLAVTTLQSQYIMVLAYLVFFSLTVRPRQFLHSLHPWITKSFVTMMTIWSKNCLVTWPRWGWTILETSVLLRSTTNLCRSVSRFSLSHSYTAWSRKNTLRAPVSTVIELCLCGIARWKGLSLSFKMRCSTSLTHLQRIRQRFSWVLFTTSQGNGLPPWPIYAFRRLESRVFYRLLFGKLRNSALKRCITQIVDAHQPFY